MQRTSGQLMGKFLSYYKGQVGLFVADIICSLAVAGIDLAFPQILRTCTRGIFGEGADAIMGALVYLAAGLVLMYLLCVLLGPRHGRSHGEPHARGPL